MKTLLVLILGLAFTSHGSFAQSAFWGLVTQSKTRPVTAIRLIKPAEVLAARVTIVASSRNASEQALAFSNTLGLFHAEILRTPAVTIKLERTQQGGGEPSYFSSGKFDTARSVAELYLHVAFQGSMDSTSAAQVLRGIISRVKLPSDVDIKIEALRVEVRDPDVLRDDLLKAIADDCARIQTMFKTTPVHITGLEHSVEQRPLNDHEILVFIPYTLSLGSEK